MIDQLFEFEQEMMPPAVVLATVALIAMFAIAIAYRAIAFIAF